MSLTVRDEKNIREVLAAGAMSPSSMAVLLNQTLPRVVNLLDSMRAAPQLPVSRHLPDLMTYVPVPPPPATSTVQPIQVINSRPARPPKAGKRRKLQKS